MRDAYTYEKKFDTYNKYIYTKKKMKKMRKIRAIVIIFIKIVATIHNVKRLTFASICMKLTDT